MKYLVLGSTGKLGNSVSQHLISKQCEIINTSRKDSQHPLVLGTIPKIETEKNVTTEEVVQKSNEDVELTGSTNIEKSFYFLTSVEGGNFTP